MIPLLLALFTLCSFSQDHSELRDLSHFDYRTTPYIKEDPFKRKTRQPKNYDSINPIVGLEEILASAEESGVVKRGAQLYNLDHSQKTILTRDISIRFHRKPDELGFKYVVDKKGEIKFKVQTEDIYSTAQVTVMHEPPHTYTPAPEIKKVFWDTELTTHFEVSLAASRVNAYFLQDLLNLAVTPSGQMNYLGLSYLADLKAVLSVGVGAYYQKAQYQADGGTSNFSSFSFGPVFKSKKFYPLETATRFFGQFRYSPLAQMDVEIARGSTGFDFNSSELVLGVEFPFKNTLGEWVISLFTHYQWLHLKNQDEIVSIESSTKPNQAVGLGISQVF